MPLTQDQIDKGKEAYRTLTNLETVHQSRQVIAHHHALQLLLDTFQTDLAPADFQAMGGGTNKSVAD